jgi:hypothetical protein
MGGHTRKLKKLLTDRKVPLSMRERLPIVADEDGILWVPFIGRRDWDGEEATVPMTYYYCNNAKQQGIEQ